MITENPKQAQQFLNNLFTGQVQPVRRVQSAKPVYDNNCTIGNNGNFFSRVRCWLHAPTLQYNQHSIFLGLNTGKSSSYSRITLEELTNLKNSIEGWISDITTIMPSILEQEAKVQQATDQSIMDINNPAFMNAVRQMIAINGNGGEAAADDFEE